MTKEVTSVDQILSYSKRADSSDNSKRLPITSEQKTIFSITRELVNAQFILSDQELTKRLWNDVAERNLDQERIINLMYRCFFQDNDEAMLDADSLYFDKIRDL